MDDVKATQPRVLTDEEKRLAAEKAKKEADAKKAEQVAAK